MDLLARDAASLVADYRSGALSPIEVAEATLAAATIAGERFGAIVCLNTDDARRAADASAARWRAGVPLSALDGVPMTFKDSFNIAGLPRFHGTAVNTGALSRADAAPVRRAREAGIVIVAKTSMPDWGLLMSGLSSQAGIIRNPWDPDTNPCGSSAGAAACLAAGVGALALGTDMVGSVRLPAAACGLVGFHASQGRVAYDPPGTYRGAGPMARSVRDAEALLEVVGRHDDADRTSLPGHYRRAEIAPTSLAGVRIAVLTALSWGDATDAPTRTAVEAATRMLTARGAVLEPITDWDLEPADYEAVYWTMVHKGSAELQSAPQARQGRVLPQIGAMCAETNTQSALMMDNVGRRLAAATTRLELQLAPYDYVLSPTLPMRAFPAEAISPTLALGAMSHMGFACWFNQMWRPAGSLPVLRGERNACPVSIQIGGRRYDDAGVFSIMTMLEQDRAFDIEFPTHLSSGASAR